MILVIDQTYSLMSFLIQTCIYLHNLERIRRDISRHETTVDLHVCRSVGVQISNTQKKSDSCLTEMIINFKERIKVKRKGHY